MWYTDPSLLRMAETDEQVSSVPASGPERHLGWGGVCDPLFTTLLSLQWSNAIQQKHPRALSSRPRGFLSQWKINLVLKQPLCLHLACKIFVNFINTADKLRDAQISTEINQVLRFWEGKVALFSDLYRGSNLSLWLRTCHNNLFLFFRKEEQHLALLRLWLIWKICKLTCNLIKMTRSH